MRRNKNTTSQDNNIQKSEVNTIIEGTKITGELETSSNFRLDGFVKGTFKSTAKIIIGSAGVIEGELFSESAEIEGKVIGNINIKGLLVLKPTAKIEGNIIAGTMNVESGAIFDGQCHIGDDIKNSNNNSKIKSIENAQNGLAS